MKYNLTAPPSSTPQNLAIDIPDLPASVTPVITGTTPIITPPVNLPPTANAGTDVTITLPTNTVSLIGRGSDPEGSAIAFQWDKTSGVGGNITSPSSANTDVTGLTEGSYTFRLTVTDDKGQTKTDDVIVTVNPVVVVQPPTQYQGFGSQAIGGSQSGVIKLVGSKAEFEAALGSNRIIRFTKTVTFQGRYELNNISFLTIDAGGFDVTIDNGIAGNGISFDDGCHHIILTGMRIINAGNDCINTAGNAHDIMIDHCSAYGGRDGDIDVTSVNGKNVTVQNCFIGNGNAGWSGEMLVTCQNASVHHNLFAPGGSPSVQERCPFAHCNYSPVGSPNLDFRNNLIFNWGRYATGFGYHAAVNIVNNYYASNKSGAIDPNADPAGNTASYFVTGNVQLGGANINLNGGNHAEYVIPDPYKIIMTDAVTAGKAVLSQVGTAKRNAYELGIINSITVQ